MFEELYICKQKKQVSSLTPIQICLYILEESPSTHERRIATHFLFHFLITQ